MRPTEIEIDTIRLELPVYYGEEDISKDFPFRDGDTLTLDVGIDTGEIIGWPQGTAAIVDMKVCDGGTYTLLKDGKSVAWMEQEYVPNGVVPGDSDYVELTINESGRIVNWPKKPDVSQFFD